MMHGCAAAALCLCVHVAAYPESDDTARGTLLHILVLLMLCIFCAIGDDDNIESK